MPKVSISSTVDPLADIELNGNHLYKKGTGESESAALVPIITSECTDLVPYVPPDPIKSNIAPNFWPHLVIQMPSAGEISTRALNNLIIDLPIYTCKSLYNSPVPTMIALYTILPSPIWNVLFPKLLRYLSLL